jgi:hypothetical protein
MHAELETENSRLKTTAAESAKMIGTLQQAVDNGIEDYNLLMEGNKNLLAEHDEFCYCCEDLNDELAELCLDAKKRTATLELKVKSTEAHNFDVAATGEKQLKDFESSLV